MWSDESSKEELSLRHTDRHSIFTLAAAKRLGGKKLNDWLREREVYIRWQDHQTIFFYVHVAVGKMDVLTVKKENDC